MLKRIRKSLTLKWMALLTLFAIIPLTIACLSILQIYPENLMRSFIEVGGIVLILGIPFSFFLTRKFIPSNKRLSKEKEQELVQRTRELETVYEMGALINEHLGDLDEILPITLKKVTSLTGYEMGAIFMLNEAGKVLEMKSQIGHSPAVLQEVKVLKFNEGVSGKAIRLKQPVIVSISDYPSPRIAPILREEGVQTVVGIPLLAKGKAIGAIILSSRSPHKLSPKEVNSLESIGSHIGIVLENAKLFSAVAKAKSEWETTFDAVTDLITILDKDYRIIRANEATFIRFGLKPEEMLGKRCFEILYHGDQPCEGCHVSETIKMKGRASGERDSQYLNGVFQHDTFPVCDEEGEVIAVVDLAREITEEKRMQMEKEVVNHVNKILVSGLDVKQGIQSVYAELKRVLDCERMTVALFDEDGEGFRFFALEKDYETGELVGNVLYPRKGTHFERIAETGLPEIIDNAEGDSWISQKLLQEEGICSTLIFPLEYKGKIIGAVNFGSTKPNQFSEAQFNLLRQIAPGLAIFIQNVLLFRETKKRLEELTILHEIAKISTSASSSIDQMLREIVDNKDLFKSEYLDIFLIEENTKRLIHRTSDKSHRYNIEHIEALGLCLGKGITGWVAEKGEPLLVNDVKKDPRYISGDESIRSEICAPLKVGQKVIGVIDAQSRELNAFSQNDLRWLNIAAGQIATLIENNRLQEEIKKSEEKYRTVVENAMDGVCVIGRNYIFKYVNERLAEIQGYTREELIGTDFRNLLDEESRALLVDREEKRARGIKLPPHFELNILHKDGGVRNAEISASAIKDSKGDVNIIVFLKDITDRRKSEEALRRSEETARRLSQENATVAEIGRIISSTLNIEEVYERFAEEVRKFIQFERITINNINPKENTFIVLYNLGPLMADREVGKPVPLPGTATEWVMQNRSSLLILEANREEMLGRIPGLLPIFKAGFRSMMLIPLISKDQVIGTLALQTAKQNAYTEVGLKLAERISAQIAGAIANAQLFIERKQVEEALRENENRLQALLDASPIGISWADMDGNIKYVNRKFVQLFGYTVNDIPTVAEWRRLAYPDPAYRNAVPSLIAKLTEAQKQGREIRPIEMTITCKDGSTRFVEQTGTFVSSRILSMYNDLTERKQMEEALRESENKFRDLAEKSVVGVYLVQDGVFRYVNARLAEINGYTVEELIDRKGPKDLTFPEDWPMVEENTRKRLSGEVESLHFEFREITKNNRIINLEVYGSRTMYRGRPALVGTLLDITDRKKTEEALRQSEERYRTILENIQEAYYEIDLAGNFTFVNDAICRHLGYSREELIGMNYRQYTDEASAKKGYQLYSRVYQTGEPIKVLDAEIIRKDGTKGTYEMSVSLIKDLQGRPAGFRGISRDITERKQMEEALRQSEERYRNILESIEDGYYEVDLAGSFTFLNDSMCRIWGYPKEELMGMNNRQYTDKESAKKVFQTFNKVYRTGEPGRVIEYEITRKDGTKRHVETSFSLIKDSSGKPIGFRGILRDITEKKKAEEQLFQAEKLRAVGEMASGVAHDFNNALAAILGNTQLLLHTAQDEELKETLKIIEKVAKDSGQTIRRLQDFTRKRVGQELFKVDVNAIIKDSMEMTKPKWKDEPQSRGIRIEMVSNLEEIPSVSGNASELREVITNMIFNAIEAMPEGGKIEIRTFKKRKNVVIRISDTGIGIGEEAERKIFEPFFTTKPFTNTGLGLSMSYGIIKRFGGEIEIESKLGQGSTFTIILPIGEEEKEEPVFPPAIKKGKQALILVIDDDEFVRSVLSRTLAQANHQVTLAESGEEGVQIFKEGKFDIVLTDLGLPGMSGWEVCRLIKEISPQTPIGMITGWGVEKNQSEVEEYGLDFFISKPFDFNQILNVVAETMASKEE